MSAVASRSASPFAAAMLAGAKRVGVGLGHGYLRFGENVLALTPPGAPRMPNGLETELVVAAGEPATVGGGVLAAAGAVVAAGPLWDPQPEPRFALALSRRPQVRLDDLPGRGPGLTPLGDDILIGYLAAAALAGGTETAATLASRFGRRTTALSGTLLRLAAGGCLPEPAHELLVEGDFGPLLRFGATSGRGIALGLALGGPDPAAGAEPVASIRAGSFRVHLFALPQAGLGSRAARHRSGVAVA